MEGCLYKGQDYYFEILNKALHDRNSFDCGISELNEFLIKFAHQKQTKHLNKIYVATQKNKIPQAGYYSLSTSSLSFESFPSESVKGIPQYYPIPTIKIGRLARDLRLTKKGFGSVLLGNALYRAMKIARIIGVFAIDVDAKNQKVKDFYRKMGFVELHNDELGMIIMTKTLENVFQMEPEIIVI